MAIVNLRYTELTLSLVDLKAKTFEEITVTIPGNRTQRNNAAIRAALREAHEAGELKCSPDAPYEIVASSFANEWFKISETAVREYGVPYTPTARERKAAEKGE